MYYIAETHSKLKISKNLNENLNKPKCCRYFFPSI